MSSNDRVRALVELAAEQDGLVTSRQARSQIGITPQDLKRLADSGVLERLHHGIYRLTRLPDDEHLNERLAWMALDQNTVTWERLDQAVPTGVLSHRTAARLLHLGDLNADEVDLSTTRRIRLSIPGVVTHRAALDRDDWQVVDRLPVTTASRTIRDLAAAALDAGHLASIVRDALTRDLSTVDDVTEALSPFAFNYGHRALDGQGFLDALIAEAGVPATTLAMADIVRRQSAGPISQWASMAQGLNPPISEALARQITQLSSASTRAMLDEITRFPMPPMPDFKFTAADNANLSEAFKAMDASAGARRALERFWEGSQ
ncbi:type IV toxin-antitoxin system AbiEi family antitoxin domain-containing protein [Dietzia maris]|uniref:type IV toxin-antitoxin system AbiEi family antitoxin domain-containing protein n=1 Tax=Dietzia maris TaxID=37915 RepID=UPI0037CC21DD